MGSNKDNDSNSNVGGHMQQSLRRAAEETTAAATVTGSGDNCNKGNKGSGNNGERDG